MVTVLPGRNNAPLAGETIRKEDWPNSGAANPEIRAYAAQATAKLVRVSGKYLRDYDAPSDTILPLVNAAQGDK